MSAGVLDVDRLAHSNELRSGVVARHANRLVHSARVPVFTRNLERTESDPDAGGMLQRSSVAHFDSRIGRGCIIQDCVQRQFDGLLHFTDRVCQCTVSTLCVSRSNVLCAPRRSVLLIETQRARISIFTHEALQHNG